MEISKMDLSRISLLKGLCESADSFLHRISWAEEKPELDDSPKESLTEILRVIGIVSAWLSPAFKNATQPQMMWGFLASLRCHYNKGVDDRRWSELDIEIARNDIRVLSELCGRWLLTGTTSIQPLETKGAW